MQTISSYLIIANNTQDWQRIQNILTEWEITYSIHKGYTPPTTFSQPINIFLTLQHSNLGILIKSISLITQQSLQHTLLNEFQDILTDDVNLNI